MNVLRLTRHDASEKQISELNRISKKFGLHGADVENVSETLPPQPREAVQRFDGIVGDVPIVEAVLPINLMQAVLEHSEFSKRGGILLRAITERTLHDNEEVTFTFSHYEHIKAVKIESERV